MNKRLDKASADMLFQRLVPMYPGIERVPFEWVELGVKLPGRPWVAHFDTTWDGDPGENLECFVTLTEPNGNLLPIENDIEFSPGPSIMPFAATERDALTWIVDCLQRIQLHAEG